VGRDLFLPRRSAILPAPGTFLNGSPVSLIAFSRNPGLTLLAQDWQFDRNARSIMGKLDCRPGGRLAGLAGFCCIANLAASKLVHECRIAETSRWFFAGVILRCAFVLTLTEQGASAAVTLTESGAKSSVVQRIHGCHYSCECAPLKDFGCEHVYHRHLHMQCLPVRCRGNECDPPPPEGLCRHMPEP
jgi:hypothetical protein